LSATAETQSVMKMPTAKDADEVLVPALSAVTVAGEAEVM